MCRGKQNSNYTGVRKAPLMFWGIEAKQEPVVHKTCKTCKMHVMAPLLLVGAIHFHPIHWLTFRNKTFKNITSILELTSLKVGISNAFKRHTIN